ncbi:alpha-L-fucosidase [Verrucomicrobiota bacterium]
MKKTLILLSILCVALNSVLASVYDPEETPQERDKRMEWWKKARFGMFIHWGAYSVLGGEYKGQTYKMNLKEHIMSTLKIPPKEYRAIIENWNPSEFNADEWITKAKSAGMRYFVITSKHHDGFCLFDSKVTDHDIVDASLLKRDVIGELAKAAEKYGVHFGVYYSQAWDWWHPGGLGYNQEPWGKTQEGTDEEYVDNIAVPQVRELLTNYKNIEVLWWDTGGKMKYAAGKKKLANTVRELRPDIVINPRLAHSDYPGDFHTLEGTFPAYAPKGHEYWEVCMTMNGSWGWTKPHIMNNWKPSYWLLRRVVDVFSLGGNVLLNIGPEPTGKFGQKNDERIEYIGAWMKENSEAVYDTQASPFVVQPWGTTTVKKNPDNSILYFHVYHWPEAKKGNVELAVNGLHSPVKEVYLLANGEKLKFRKKNNLLTVRVPVKSLHESVTVIKAILDTPDVEVEPGYPVLDEKKDTILSVKQARISHLDGFIEIKGKGDNIHIDNWTYESWLPSNVNWDIRVKKAGTYKLKAMVASEKPNHINTVIDSGGSRIQYKRGTPYIEIPATGGMDNFKLVDIKEVTFQTDGIHRISLAPTTAEKWDKLRLKYIVLTMKQM